MIFCCLQLDKIDILHDQSGVPILTMQVCGGIFFHNGHLVMTKIYILYTVHVHICTFNVACIAGWISRASAFFSSRMFWSWPPSSEGIGEESS